MYLKNHKHICVILCFLGRIPQHFWPSKIVDTQQMVTLKIFALKYFWHQLIVATMFFLELHRQDFWLS